MSGSSGKMGGAESEMKDGLKEGLLNKVKVTDQFWHGYQELVMDTVIPYQEKILNDEIPSATSARTFFVILSAARNASPRRTAHIRIPT